MQYSNTRSDFEFRNVSRQSASDWRSEHTEMKKPGRLSVYLRLFCVHERHSYCYVVSRSHSLKETMARVLVIRIGQYETFSGAGGCS